MIKILKNIKQYFKKLKFVRDQKKNLTKKGTLLHVFSEKKQIFIHIPKTAGISVVKAFFGDVNQQQLLLYQIEHQYQLHLLYQQ